MGFENIHVFYFLSLFLVGESYGPGSWEEAEGAERPQLGISRASASEIAGTAADTTLRSAGQKWVNLFK